VKVGLNDNITAEIVSGLNEGDLVVMPRGSTQTSPATTNNNRRGPGGLGGAGALFGGGGGRRGG